MLGEGTKKLMRGLGIIFFILALICFFYGGYHVERIGAIKLLIIVFFLFCQGLLFNVVASLIDANISNPAEIRKRVAEENKRVNKDVKFNKIDWDD